MNILVLGGTGAMGVHLVQILADDGYNVDVTSRKIRKDGRNVHYIQGDAHDISFIEKICINKRYHAIVDFMTYTTEHFKSCYKLYLKSTDQYFLLSTSRVYANAETIKESTPRLLDVVDNIEYLATDEYALKKAREEDILRNSLSDNYTIIRPYKTYSEKRLQLGSLDKETVIQRALKGHAIVVPMDIMDHITTLTYGRDVAYAIAKLIGKKEAMGETYHITADKTISWMDVLNIYKKALEEKMGKAVKIVAIPTSPELRHPIVKWQIMYDLYYDRKFDNSKIKSAVPDLQFTDPYVGLEKCVKEFLDSPSYLYFDARHEGICDHYAHNFTSPFLFKGYKQKIIYLLYRLFPNLMDRVLF